MDDSDTVSGFTEVPTSDNATKYFHPLDYVVFGIMLFLSAAIGIYFAIRSRQRGKFSTSDYLMAGREMSYGPVSLSLMASFMSSVTILGLPAEYYVYGTMFSWFGLVYLVIPVILIGMYVPLFYELGLASTYEYLELRYNRTTRIMVTCLYLILSTLYGGIVTYGPALALSRVTGLNIWGSILCTGSVCTFYTTLGGLKAVIWTDVLQSVIMLSGFLIVIIQGSINLGGFSNIWQAAEEGGRIDFLHFEVDPRVRNSFWSIMLGGCISWVTIYGLNQSQVQRYVSCKTKKDAKIAVYINCVGLVVILVLAGMTGLTIYATYKDCDPINNGQVEKADQLFPFIIMDIVGHIPGLPGLFVAAVFSSSLSTISSGINAMACVTLEDFIKPVTDWKELTYTRVSRIFVLLFGVLYIVVAYLASEIGGLIRMSYSINGVINGPIGGVFTIGMLAPWVNEYGAMSGIVAGMASTIWVFLGSTIYPPPDVYTRPLPRSTDGCAQNIYLSTTQNSTTSTYFEFSNVTTETSTFHVATSLQNDVIEIDSYRPPVAEFYYISYLHYSTVGFTITILVAIIVSLLTGCTKRKPPNDDLLVHFMRRNNADEKKITRYATEGIERSTSWVSPGRLLVQPPDDIENGNEATKFLAERRLSNDAKNGLSSFNNNATMKMPDEVFEKESVF